MRINFQSLLLLASFASSAAGCNGDARLCGRKYSNITQIGAHNRGAADPESGARGGGAVGYGDPLPASSVVTLLLTNQDKADVSIFGKAMVNSGLAKFAYTPPKKLALNEWPTLQEMINSNKRLVMFLDYHADTAKVPYILDEFAYCFETPFSQTDPKFPQCSVDRPPNASSAGRFSIINHVLDIALTPGKDGVLIPDILGAEKTNSVASIMAQVGLCQMAHGTTPNFILLDYAERGEAIKAQNIMNHLV
ncbi:hypothetical protein V500_00378 [Pseudogymnoascus sp. VKM F-4518 (FW-2643)]|nr:hypothetical protein V500_00378 [Pseudogymnoascus sp. VKM F-4518 (FW-2643)]